MSNILLELESHTQEILQEFLNYNRKTTPIVGLQDSSTYGKKNIVGWSGIPLWWQYRPMKMLQKKFPKTVALMQDLACHTGTGFLVLDSNCGVPPHNHKNDIWANKIICHLPLIIPEDGKCGMNIDGVDYDWEVGKIFSFDADREHSTYNTTNGKRVTLFFNFEKEQYEQIIRG